MTSLLGLTKWMVFVFHVNLILRWSYNISTFFFYLIQLFFLWEMWTRRENPVCLVILSLVISLCKALLRNHFIKCCMGKLAALHSWSVYSVISLTLRALGQSVPHRLKQVRYVSSARKSDQRLLYRMFQREPQSSSPGTMKEQTRAHGRHPAQLVSCLAKKVIPRPQCLHF